MLTIINVLFAVLSFPARFALARIVVHQIGTLAAVQTWRRLAVVHVRFTVFANVAQITVTLVAGVQIFALRRADRTARIRHTFLDLRLTVQSQERRSAFANGGALLSDTYEIDF